MANPVLVEILRGRLVETVHRGAFVISDAGGAVCLEGGDIDRPIFPRSAIKAMQALFLIESGAAQSYGFSDKELALSAASHSGETAHIELAEQMLVQAGLSVHDLECGCHWSFQNQVLVEQVRSCDHPSACHNNCSGKHAGFLCATHHLGEGTSNYVHRDHFTQKQVAAIVADLTQAPMSDELCAIDGCSIPTYAMPLNALAQGFAKMVTGEGLSSQRADASKRIINACMKEPFYVAGSGRACTKLMQMAPGRIFAKTGAEGVFCGALPELGLGIALKIDDGANRAAEVAMASLLSRMLGPDDCAFEPLQLFANRPMKNWNNIKVGQFRTLC